MVRYFIRKSYTKVGFRRFFNSQPAPGAAVEKQSEKKPETPETPAKNEDEEAVIYELTAEDVPK